MANGQKTYAQLSQDRQTKDGRLLIKTSCVGFAPFVPPVFPRLHSETAPTPDRVESYLRTIFEKFRILPPPHPPAFRIPFSERFSETKSHLRHRISNHDPYLHDNPDETCRSMSLDVARCRLSHRSTGSGVQ